jgi:thioredoxin-like negative regulator of GroEL
MTDHTNSKIRSIAITLGVILFVILVALLKNTAQERAWLNLEPATDRAAAYRAAGQPLVVYFHSPDCSSCAQVQDALDLVYPEFKDTVALLDVDVTSRRERAFVDASGVKITPTLLFIDSSGAEKLFAGEIENDVLRVELSTLAGGAP